MDAARLHLLCTLVTL